MLNAKIFLRIGQWYKLTRFPPRLARYSMPRHISNSGNGLDLLEFSETC